jgi:hypothetical protein
MKNKMKYFIISIFAISLGYCQNDYTVLSESTYNTIKFHDVLFTDIMATDGNNAQMANLFPTDINDNNSSGIGLADPNDVTIDEYGQEIDEVEKSFIYQSGLKVYFSNDDQDPELEVIGINAKKITIDGESLEIGDSIGVLTNLNYVVQTGNSNYKFVEIVKTGHYSTPITISLDINNQITQIEYYINP